MRVRLVLRKKGLNVMPATLYRFQTLLQRYRPGLLSKPAPVGSTNGKVVKLRPEDKKK